MSDLSEKELKKLCMKNGRFCAMCHTDLIIGSQSDGDTIIAEKAHIHGERPSAARYDPNMTEAQCNISEDNRILVCGNCHKTIDKTV